MNKKFKTFLCGTVAFVAGSMGLGACSAKVDVDQNEGLSQIQETIEQVETSISLVKAKDLIMNALAVDGIQDNRNFMIKFGITSGSADGIEYANTNEAKNYALEVAYRLRDTIEMECEVTPDNTARLVKARQREEYTEGSYRGQWADNYGAWEEGIGYTRAPDGTISTYEFDSDGIYDSTDNNNLFNERDFSNYEDTVAKQKIDNGYILTLKGKDVVVESSVELPAALLAKLNKLQVEVTFNNNNEIVALRFNRYQVSKSNDQYKVYDSVYYFTKAESIAEPEWVTEYRNNQNND